MTPSPRQLYSGMLPGWMAGHFALPELTIDLARLTARAGVRLLLSRAVGMDADRRTVMLAEGGELTYDLLSLDIGSAPDEVEADPGTTPIGVRPLERFTGVWPTVLEAVRVQPTSRLVIVGAGAAGVELAFAARHAVRAIDPQATVSIVTADGIVLPSHGVSTQRRVRRLLAEQEIAVHAGLAHVVEGGVHVEGVERVVPADHVLIATGGRAPATLQGSGLALSPTGHVAVDACHRSISHPTVFAAGDVCERVDLTLPRSGVHAVRAGPVLAHNLLGELEGGTLRRYQPRTHTLALLATGPRHAIASWGAWSADGVWVWYWKRWLDRSFVRRFS